jgi:hypothetical protein
MHVSFYLILTAVFILLVLICVYLYLSIGAGSSDAILNFERKIRKYFNKPAVIVIDAPSYFQQRKSRYKKMLLILFITSHVIILVAGILLKN